MGPSAGRPGGGRRGAARSAERCAPPSGTFFEETSAGDRIRADPGTALMPHCYSMGTPQVLDRHCADALMSLQWYSTSTALELHWCCKGTALVLCWHCASATPVSCSSTSKTDRFARGVVVIASTFQGLPTLSTNARGPQDLPRSSKDVPRPPRSCVEVVHHTPRTLLRNACGSLPRAVRGPSMAYKMSKGLQDLPIPARKIGEPVLHWYYTGMTRVRHPDCSGTALVRWCGTGTTVALYRCCVVALLLSCCGKKGNAGWGTLSVAKFGRLQPAAQTLGRTLPNWMPFQIWLPSVDIPKFGRNPPGDGWIRAAFGRSPAHVDRVRCRPNLACIRSPFGDFDKVRPGPEEEMSTHFPEFAQRFGTSVGRVGTRAMAKTSGPEAKETIKWPMATRTPNTRTHFFPLAKLWRVCAHALQKMLTFYPHSPALAK